MQQSKMQKSQLLGGKRKFSFLMQQNYSSAFNCENIKPLRMNTKKFGGLSKFIQKVLKQWA